MAQRINIKVAEALVNLGYISSEDIARSIAEEYGREFVDLKGVAIPPAVVELVPESVARENRILPYQVDGDTLKILMSDPNDIETLDKLRFILNRSIEPVLAAQELIQEAINRHYTQSIGESADSLIQEMTDTQIDFTATDSVGGGGVAGVADSHPH
jgi:type IV pilus assembly protein PilB